MLSALWLRLDLRFIGVMQEAWRTWTEPARPMLQAAEGHLCRMPWH